MPQWQLPASDDAVGLVPVSVPSSMTIERKIQTVYEYRATVVKWVDGDTADIEISLGFYVTIRQRVRLYGVNAPESNSGDAAEREAGKAAREFAQFLAPVDSVVKVATVKDKDKYGRFLATMTDEDGLNVADALIAHGHGKPYFGGTR